MTKQDIDANRLYAALSYLWILFLVPIFIKKNSKFAIYHAKQGLVLFIFEFFAVAIGWIPFFGWFISMAMGLVFAILTLLGILNALAGKEWEIPFFGYYAKKIKL